MNIPDEAMRAAIKAMETVTPPPGVELSEWLSRHGPFSLLAGAVAAAAPHLMAEAWDEGYTIGNAHNGRRDANPYRRDA